MSVYVIGVDSLSSGHFFFFALSVFFLLFGIVDHTLVNVSVTRPRLMQCEIEERHVELESLCWTIVVPKLQAAFDVLSSGGPVTLDVTLEGLTEDGVELLDVLLEADNVTVKSEHVVNALVLEAFNVDGLVLLELDEVTNEMVFLKRRLFIVVETQVESIQSHRLLAFLVLLHSDHIDLAECVTCFQRHQVVHRLRKKNLHVVVLTQIFDSLNDSHVRREIAGISLTLRSNSSLDGVALMNSNSKHWLLSNFEVECLHEVRLLEVLLDTLRAPHLRNNFNCCNQTFISQFSALLHR